MPTLTDRNNTSDSDNAFVEIASGDQSGEIANVNSDKELLVRSSLKPGSFPCFTNILRYKDMNASVGGVARETSIGTSFVDIYNESGSGVLLGFLVTLELGDTKWRVRLEVDGSEVFDVLTSDFESSDIYNLAIGISDPLSRSLGFTYRNKTLHWEAPSQLPLCYSSNVTVQVRRTSSPNKNFEAGLISITGV